MRGDNGKQDVGDRNPVAGATKFFSTVSTVSTVVFMLLLVGAVVVGLLQFVHVWRTPTDKDPTTIEDPRNREMPETNPLAGP